MRLKIQRAGFSPIISLLSLFPALAVELDIRRFTLHYPGIPTEKLGHLVTADLLAKWIPGLMKFLFMPLVFILILSHFGSEFERGNVLLMLSKPLTRRRYFLAQAVEGLKLVAVIAAGIALSGTLAMLAHGFAVEDYIIGSLALSLSLALVGVVGVALLLLFLATSREAGVALGIGAFVILMLAGQFEHAFIPTSYLDTALSIGEGVSVSHRAVGELLAASVFLSLAGMEAFRRRELRGREVISAPGFSFSPRGLYGVFLGLSLQSKRFLAFLVLVAATAFFNTGSLGDHPSSVPRLLNALISSLNGVCLPFVVLPLGVLSLSSAIEDGTVGVLLSKPLKRRDFFLGKLLSDISAVFIGTALYVIFTVAYALHLGAGSKAVELGAVFGFLLLLSLFQYLALGYLLSAFLRGRRGLLASLMLAFALPLPILAAYRSLDVLARKALFVPSPFLQYIVLDMAVSPKNELLLKPVGEILNYPGNLALLVVPTLVYLAVSWLKFRKADLR
ncbi:MAG: ABC transporter permease subunit [Thermococcus sp.]|nr:ABC transporter permease subunit [Thermococcus sp.]